MKNEDRQVLEKIVGYCNDVESLKRISFQYSCNMCIIQIGELVSRLSDEFLVEHSEIPWHAIKAMRNLHAHYYERVDLGMVWPHLQKRFRN